MTKGEIIDTAICHLVEMMRSIDDIDGRNERIVRHYTCLREELEILYAKEYVESQIQKQSDQAGCLL